MIIQVNRGEMEIVNYPKYHGLEPVDNFLNIVDEEITEDQRIPILNINLMATLARWWKTHCSTLRDWVSIKKSHEGKISP